jgi:hypothetical protein
MNEIILYQAENNQTQIKVRFGAETVLLNLSPKNLQETKA